MKVDIHFKIDHTLREWVKERSTNLGITDTETYELALNRLKEEETDSFILLEKAESDVEESKLKRDKFVRQCEEETYKKQLSEQQNLDKEKEKEAEILQKAKEQQKEEAKNIRNIKNWIKKAGGEDCFYKDGSYIDPFSTNLEGLTNLQVRKIIGYLQKRDR